MLCEAGWWLFGEGAGCQALPGRRDTRLACPSTPSPCQGEGGGEGGGCGAVEAPDPPPIPLPEREGGGMRALRARG